MDLRGKEAARSGKGNGCNRGGKITGDGEGKKEETEGDRYPPYLTLEAYSGTM